jgi:hypothetical protein
MWTIPGITNVDDDLGASPTLFEATLKGVSTPMVGACDKNGLFYAWRANNLAAGPVWTRQVGDPANPSSSSLDMCLAAATWDASDRGLFHASNSTTIGGTAYPASVRRLNPATGASVWQVGLRTGPVLGTATLDGAGVLAVTTYHRSTSSLYLVNAANGAIVRTIALDGLAFPQPAFADQYLFIATGASLTAWAA